MFIHINANNEIIKRDYELPLITKGYPNYEDIDFNKIRIENFMSGQFEYSSIYIHIYKNKLDFISMPRAPHSNIFYMQDKNKNIYISDDFFRLITECSYEGINLDHKSINFFFSNGYYEAGNTPFLECKRLIPGNIYKIKNNCIKKISNIRSKFFDQKFTYENFEKIFESYIENFSYKKSSGIMLSGGVDSTSVAIALSKVKTNLKSYSMRNFPEMNIIERDLYGAKQTSSYFSIDHKTVNINFEKLKESDFSKYVIANPMATHLSVNFDEIIKTMNNDDIEIAFTGQNLDTLYNFGPTTAFALNRSGLSDFFRRFYLTAEYTKSIELYNKKYLPDIGSFAFKNIGELGALLYSIYKGKRFYPPSNNSELASNYKKSADYVTFSKNKFNKKIPKDFIDSSNVHYNLFKDKIENYIMSGDSQVIRRAGDLHSVKTLFPFSSESIINFWSGQTLTWKDLFIPKRFIHRYVKKNYPNYNERKSAKIRNLGLSPHDWADEILNTPIFKEFQDLHSDKYCNKEKITSMQKVQQALSSYWFHKTLSILKNFNVDILNY